MSDLHVLQTKSGRRFTPLSDKDVLEVIYDEMGQDVHDYLADRLSDVDFEAELAQEKFESDYSAMESEIESWHDFVDDLSNDIERLRVKIEDNKPTKARISVELYKIYEKMREEL